MISPYNTSKLLGAAFGRLIGESMSVWFPSGIGGQHIVPGGIASYICNCIKF